MSAILRALSKDFRVRVIQRPGEPLGDFVRRIIQSNASTAVLQRPHARGA